MAPTPMRSLKWRNAVAASCCTSFGQGASISLSAGELATNSKIIFCSTAEEVLETTRCNADRLGKRVSLEGFHLFTLCQCVTWHLTPLHSYDLDQKYVLTFKSIQMKQ